MRRFVQQALEKVKADIRSTYWDVPPTPLIHTKDELAEWKRRQELYKGDHAYVDKAELAPDPWAAVDAIVKREIEPTGPEWFTPRQFADRYHVSLNRAHEVCNRLAKEGKLRRWKGTSLTTHKTATKYAPA